MILIEMTDLTCPLCRGPVSSTHSHSRGIRANRIAALGAKLVRLRERKRTLLVCQEMTDLMAELAILGASLNENGWVVTDEF